jgi:hypothetical protein
MKLMGLNPLNTVLVQRVCINICDSSCHYIGKHYKHVNNEKGGWKVHKFSSDSLNLRYKYASVRYRIFVGLNIIEVEPHLSYNMMRLSILRTELSVSCYFGHRFHCCLQVAISSVFPGVALALETDEATFLRVHRSICIIGKCWLVAWLVDDLLLLRYFGLYGLIL